MNVNFTHVAIIGLLLIVRQTEASFLGWLFNPHVDSDQKIEVSPAPAPSELKSDRQVSARTRPVLFEMKSAEDKFLNSGRELMIDGLSKLDTCHHRVVAQLKVHCNDITEEELAKLGVALFNCQSQAEGRITYTCTEDMTVADCTKEMDPNTWNSYHIISNRARSVCYAVRQQQFQKQTQVAVNQLAASTEEQIYVMQFMQESHEQLSNLATGTLEEMTKGQKQLTETQDRLKDSQVDLQTKINSNLDILTKEKSLIAAGHKELASMTDDIRLQLENATKEILNQDKERRHNHDQVVNDLAGIQQKTKDAWQKFDQHMRFMETYQQETAHHYNDTLKNLKKMNDTIIYLLKVVHEMQTEVEDRLGWITTFMGGAGENLALLSTCTLHSCYFVLAAMTATFLQTPIFTRLILLVLVPLNAIAEIRHGVSLEMAPLTLIICAVAFVNCLATVVCAKIHSKQSTGQIHVCSQSSTSTTSIGKMCESVLKIPANEESRLHELLLDEDYIPSTTTCSITSDEEETTFMTDSSLLAETTICSPNTLMSGSRKGYISDVSRLQTPQLSSTANFSPSTTCPSVAETSMYPDKAKRHLGSVLETVRQRTPSPTESKGASPARRSRSSTPNKHPCGGMAKTGLPCRQSCTPGKDFCWRHINAKSL